MMAALAVVMVLDLTVMAALAVVMVLDLTVTMLTTLLAVQ